MDRIAESLNGTNVDSHRNKIKEWQGIIADFQESSAYKANIQLLNSVGSYVLTWVAMYFTVQISWWLTIPLCVLAMGFLMRSFIIFHDCGHGSFFKSRSANDFWGVITGVLSFTPYFQWRWEHSVHHASAGDLNRRGIGDVSTMTVEEYLAASKWKRFGYRLLRNPIVLFVIAPQFLFLIWQRFSVKGAKAREIHGVWLTNIAILAMATTLSIIYGFKNYVIIQGIIMLMTGTVGVWLFYVQHQYEGVYWERGKAWDFTDAALKGSSYYKLPKVLQWFSGNIGFHHIHHLSSRIPNYYLEEVYKCDPMFQQSPTLTLKSSLKSLQLRLWDEANRKLIGYKELRRIRKERALEKKTG